MKSLFVFAALFSFAASATPLPKSMVQKLAQHSHIRPLDDNQPSLPNPLTPIRQAHIKATILKTIVTKQADNSYSATVSTVCTSTADISVYDARGLQEYSIANQPAFSCDSTMDDKPVKVQVSGLVVLNHYKPFEDEDARDFKDIGAWTSVTGPDTPTTNLTDAFVATPDMGQTSIYGNLQQYLILDPTTVKEFFQAAFEVVDTP